MKVIIWLILSLGYCPTLMGWGQTGHRTVGLVAELNLMRKVKKNIKKILNGQSMAMVSNFMDEIRSDERYARLSPWHYCTIPDGKTYEDAGTPEEGDIIYAIDFYINELKSKTLSVEEEAFALKCLIHLVADIHQPLHVGNGKDRGGNDLEVEYFWKPSNLHRVWDTGIIDAQNLSYTEYANWIYPSGYLSSDEIDHWQNSNARDWAKESVSYRKQVYDLPDDRKINYAYNYVNIKLVNLRLLQAGIRLAGILNDIYG